MKEFKCENGKTYLFSSNHCVFCEHCTDIFYDYTHGPYMYICELQKKYVNNCDKFEKEREDDESSY